MDLSKYLGLFVSEAAEHLGKLGVDLVRVEAAGRSGAPLAELVDGMFRHAHSVKGMAASMELEGIAAVAHRAEDLLGALRGRSEAPRAEVVDALLAAVDVMQGMVERAARGEAPAADEALLARLLAEVEREAGPQAAAPKPAQTTFVPPPAPPAAAPAPAIAPASRRRFAVQVTVADACPVPAVRGFLVVKKLAALGGVVASTPSVDDLRAARIPERRLAVTVETAEPREAIDRALATIADLAAVDVREEASAPAPSAAPPAPRDAERDPGGRTVRVKAELLDQFLDAVGELILATARVREVGKNVPEPFRQPLDEGMDRLHATVKDIHDRVMAVRMTPIAAATERLPRAARDLARRLGKQVEVEIRGADIELDRSMLDEIADPLLHVIRNAVDHGVEAPEVRALAGKPPSGRITVHARRERDRVFVEVSDDGKGMDPERLRRAAVARGQLTEAQAASLSDREALLLACSPGLSTASEVTDVSGRGVGMDVVKKSVESVGGALLVESVPGQGTRVTLRLPLTVAVQPVLLVRVGEEVLGVPIAKVHGAALVELEALDRTRGDPVMQHDGRLVPVHDLGALLGFGAPPVGPRSVVVADGDGDRVGLAVDALLGEAEAVMKPLAGPLERVPGLSAVTVLGNGRPVFILDVQRLVTWEAPR